MQFAHPIPWPIALVAAAALCALAVVPYWRPLAALSMPRRGVLIALRALALASLVIFLLRPIALMPPASVRDAVVPVVVDVSRSMRLADAGGQTRVSRAAAIVKRDLLPSLAPIFTPELFSAGETLAPA